jgi:hypothetical protein
LIRLTAGLSPAAQESKGGRNMLVTCGSSRPFFWDKLVGSLVPLLQCLASQHLRKNLAGKGPGNAPYDGPGGSGRPGPENVS